MNTINGERYSDRSSDELPLRYSKRDPFGDAVKGALIFLVVYGHSIQFVMTKESDEIFWDSVIFKCIYLFHMPLFMLVSGYFSASGVVRSGYSVVGKYSKRLLLPILSYSLLIFAVGLFLKGGDVKQLPIAFLCTLNDHAWFLSAVFICTCFLCVYSCAGSIVGKIFLGFFPVFFFLVLRQTPYIGNLFAISYQITYLWPFFLLGFLLKQHHFGSDDIPKWWLVFVPITIATAFLCDKSLFVYNTPLNWSWYGLGIDLLRTAAAVSGCMAFCACIRCWQTRLNAVFLLKLGQATLAIYLLQTIFFSYFSKPIQETHIISNEAGAFVFGVILTAVTFGFYLLSRKIKWVRLLLYGENFH